MADKAHSSATERWDEGRNQNGSNCTNISDMIPSIDSTNVGI